MGVIEDRGRGLVEVEIAEITRRRRKGSWQRGKWGVGIGFNTPLRS
jgi:hypothetical protein